MRTNPQPAAVGGDVPGATSDPREEVLVRFSEGHIITDSSFEFFRVRANLFKLDNTPDGFYEGVYQLTTSPYVGIFNRPSNPVPPYDTPVGPVEHVTTNTYTKGRWAFADGSSIYAVGNANFHAVRTSPAANSSVLLWVTGDQIITGGTGIYQGAEGLKIIGGSAEAPDFPIRPTSLFQKVSGLFAARTVDCFRIVRAQYIYRRA
jgi:hypothetical protein